jgi:hypothetical protein
VKDRPGATILAVVEGSARLGRQKSRRHDQEHADRRTPTKMYADRKRRTVANMRRRSVVPRMPPAQSGPVPPHAAPTRRQVSCGRTPHCRARTCLRVCVGLCVCVCVLVCVCVRARVCVCVLTEALRAKKRRAAQEVDRRRPERQIHALNTPARARTHTRTHAHAQRYGADAADALPRARAADDRRGDGA